MAEQQEKLKKLFNARSNLESDLCNIHKDITDAIDRQSRRVKVERLVSKLKDVFSKLVQKNEELFDLASKAENPDSIYPVLEQWLDDVTKNNDKFLLAARSYIDSVADRDTVCEGVNPQEQSKRSSRRTTSSISSQRKHEFLMAKLKREEAEKQEQAAMRLAKQKHEIAKRKKELEIQMEQMALQELEEDHRQRVAAAKLDEADLMDNHSLFSHHSSELNLFKDRGSDRSQGLVQDWVNSFPAGNSSELNFSRPGSATADPPVKDTPSNPPENTSNVADNLHHLEIVSQYTRPGVAISVAQQEALYREYLQAQLQQPLSDQRVEQAHSPSGSGKVNPVNQIPVDVQNVALPTLQPPTQPPRPPTPVMAPTNSSFAPNLSTNPQVNQLLGPKSSSVPGQLHMSMPHFPQLLNRSQSNISHQTQFPIVHSPHNVPPLLNPLVNPPPVFPPQQLYHPQPPWFRRPFQRAQQHTYTSPTFHNKTLSIHLKPAWYRVLQHKDLPRTVTLI